MFALNTSIFVHTCEKKSSKYSGALFGKDRREYVLENNTADRSVVYKTGEIVAKSQTWSHDA